MSKKTADRRSSKTEKAIKQALVTLLREKPLDHISVRELSELADINRTTFYAHYPDIYALFHDFEKDLSSQVLKIFNDRSLTTYDAFYSKLLDYINDNREAARLVVLNSRRNTDSLGQEMKDLFIEMAKKTWDSDYHLKAASPDLEYYAYFRVYGLMAMVGHWLAAEGSISLTQLKQDISTIDRFIDTFMLKEFKNQK
jgi:AcrR family transcriptional regulator